MIRRPAILTQADVASHWGTILYVIGPKRGPVKIGISGSPEGRIAGLQTGHPYELSLLAQVAVRENGIESENSIHQFLSPYRVRENGEWFHRSHEVGRLIEMVYCRLSPDVIMEKLREERKAALASNRDAWAANRAYRRRYVDGVVGDRE